ncbi:MAG: alpha/beta fold hydrolase [Holdemania massiliensis]
MLHYDESGSPDHPTILLLPGAGALDTFNQQYGFAVSYHLLVLHLPGSGKASGVVYDPHKTTQELLELIQSLHQKVGVIGHSLGAQIAIRLVSEHPEFFHFAIFLSAWVNRIRRQSGSCALAKISAKMLHWQGLVRLQGWYWHYTSQQARTMADDSKRISAKVYRSFFVHTLDLSSRSLFNSKYSNVSPLRKPGDQGNEESLALLAENPHCQQSNSEASIMISQCGMRKR